MPKANKLKAESSPYLLQHAYNPVDWEAWNEESLQRAKTEDKPILLSIGYAACHWCHVMEHESFEDESVAAIMNENYVCIKLDREERPDIDQIYMDAIQNMGLHGGWPLNVFLTPDQKPFYGGTYFPKPKWKDLLDKIAVAFQNNRDALEESAQKFALSIQHSGLDFDRFQAGNSFKKSILDDAYAKLRNTFDWDNGGTAGAPKFPMPVIWESLLTYFHISEEEEAGRMLNFTMQEMAKGGIYDQLGGGFSRYSVDNEWFAPHFEKMLYDNAQLISLYAKLYNTFNFEPFRWVVDESLEFVVRELGSPEKGFYSALDADSEGVEGKFYTWTKEEWTDGFNSAEESEAWSEFFNITKVGNWENGRNIVYRHTSYAKFAEHKKKKPDNFISEAKKVKKALFDIRSKRIRPALDNKILCSWNALMLTAICDAYKYVQKEEYLKLAEENYQFITSKLYQNGQLYRTYSDGNAKLDAYLEDYALMIEACIQYFELTSEVEVLQLAEKLAQYTLDHFFDDDEKLFYYTDVKSEKLIARKKEVFDNVIPSSNAVMAENLHWLGILTANHDWSALSDEMVLKFSELIPNEPRYLSRWSKTYALKASTSYDIIVSGKEAQANQMKLWKKNLLNAKIIKLEDSQHSTLPLFQGKKAADGESQFHVCIKNSCKAPVNTIQEVLRQVTE